jgi:hypothetical protein
MIKAEIRGQESILGIVRAGRETLVSGRDLQTL